MLLIVLSAVIGISGVSFAIWKSRQQSILGIPARNRHFRKIGQELQLMTSSDDYFLQLEGEWKGTPVIVYPHNFHGPGTITLFYADTGVPYRERTWIEPSVSLGRAIVEWKNNVSFSYDYSGDSSLHHKRIVDALTGLKMNYPFVAITLPTRFIFSHYVLQVISEWKSYVVLLVLDAGRRPTAEQIANVLNDATELAKTVRETIGSLTLSTST